MRQKNFLISRQYCTYRQGKYTRRHSTSTEKHKWKQAMPCKTAAGRELNTGTRDTAWQHRFLPMSQIFPLNCTSPCQAAQSPQGRHHPGFVLITARVNARSCWFHPPFFSQETVCVYLKLPQMTAYTTSHTVQKVCKTIKTSKQYRQVFFARSIAPFSLLCLHWSSISGRWCHKLRKKKKLLKELHEPHYNCKRQKQKDKYKVKVFLHTYQPSIYTKLLQAL